MKKEIFERNTKWFLKVYDSFIKIRLERGLDKSKLTGYYEKHHIIPKCMGGLNEDSNYVLLTYREHIFAHKLLCRIYPDEPGNFISLYAILINTNKNHKRDISLSSKYLAEFKKEYISQIKEISLKQLGKDVSKEIRDKISKSNTGKKVSDSAKEKLRKTRYSISIKDPNGIVYESIKLCSDITGISQTTLKNWIYNKPEKGYSIISSTKPSRNIPVIGPDGTEYKSIRECARQIKRDFNTVKKWIEKYPELGYKYKT